jgi:hypothetical protein
LELDLLTTQLKKIKTATPTDSSHHIPHEVLYHKSLLRKIITVHDRDKLPSLVPLNTT